MLGKLLQKVPVHKGDTYFVPAGTVHGIGKGILVAEIQESPNVTYRVYDYDCIDKNGKKNVRKGCAGHESCTRCELETENGKILFWLFS